MKTKQAHTPGPWKAKKLTNTKSGQYPDAWVITGSEKNAALPFAFKDAAWDVGTAEGEADARLIAAAPDLLEALERMVNLAIEDGEASELCECEAYDQGEKCSLCAAQIAIAKAERK